MRSVTPSPLLFTLYSLLFTLPPPPFLDPETLRPVWALPPHVTGAFEFPTGFQQSPAGDYFIFDRRSHTVFTYKPGTDAARKVIQIGAERGRVLQPSAFDFAADNTFVIADAPGRQQRIQIFFETGASLGGFTVQARDLPRVSIGGFVLNGVGSLEYTGSSVLISQPETGALVTEYGVDGSIKRSFGELRGTGQESDPQLHAALNAGLPLVNPKGGFYFVFVAGMPAFRKYDAAGKLIFERHVQGIQLDDHLRTLPTTWKARESKDGELPVVVPTVRTAAVDGDGNLWISLAVPYTYVYDGSGDKRRIIQFNGAGIIAPTSLFFTRDDRVLVTPGCYAFSRKGELPARNRAALGSTR